MNPTMMTTARPRIDTNAIRANNPLLQAVQQVTGEEGEKKGGWIMFHCPKHGGQSLHVIDDHFECFGCGIRGDIIDFVMAVRNLNFIDACKSLLDSGLPQVDLDEFKRKNEAKRAEEDRKQADALARLKAEQPWLTYHREMTDAQRLWWRKRGIPDAWQNEWLLGYTPDRIYKLGEEYRHSPAYVIPYQREHHQVVTLQYRLLDFPEESGKYRFEGNLGSPYYLADPERGLKGPGVIVEGPIKAMVSYLHGFERKLQVVGLPSVNTFAGLDTLLKDAKDEWCVILDPDAWHRPKGAGPDWVQYPVKLQRAIGRKGRVLRMSRKIDDALISGELDPAELRWLMQFTSQQSVFTA